MKLSSKLIALMAAGLLSATSGLLAQNACSPCASPCTPCASPCFNPCDWNLNPCSWDLGCHNFYVGAGAIYGRSGDLHGWGGSGRVGYFFSGKHAIELELNGWEEKGHANGIFGPTSNPAVMGGTLGLVTASRTAKLNQWALMFNYRYHGQFSDFICSDSCWTDKMLYYFGGGIGIDFARTKDTYFQIFSEQADPTQTQVLANYSNRKSHTEFAAQLFAGLGYAFTDCLSFNVGARAFFTDAFVYRDTSSIFSDITPLKASSTHLIVDLGLAYRF